LLPIPLGLHADAQRRGELLLREPHTRADLARVGLSDEVGSGRLGLAPKVLAAFPNTLHQLVEEVFLV
jgi:hypothetical protein